MTFVITVFFCAEFHLQAFQRDDERFYLVGGASQRRLIFLLAFFLVPKNTWTKIKSYHKK